jgi:hypothetical protein
LIICINPVLLSHIENKIVLTLKGLRVKKNGTSEKCKNYIGIFNGFSLGQGVEVNKRKKFDKCTTVKYLLYKLPTI